MDQEHKISKDAVKVFRIKEFIGMVIIFVIFVAFFKLLPNFKFKNIVSGIFVAIIILNFISALIIPKIEYKNWSYYMEKDKVIFRYGVLVIKTVVIPIKRIQYVDTSTGPILSHFQLTNLAIYTAGGRYEIPALIDNIAKELQNAITSSVVRSLDEDEI